MKEGDFLKKFMGKLKLLSEFMWYFKTHGEPMQTRGIPDVLLCWDGLFVGIEFKIMRKGKVAATPYQEYTLELIDKANGKSVIAWYDERDASVGLGEKRYKDMDEAVKNLVSLLTTMSNIAPTAIRMNKTK